MRESSAEMRNDHTPGTEHFTDMLQNENARRLGPTAEGPRCEAVCTRSVLHFSRRHMEGCPTGHIRRREGIKETEGRRNEEKGDVPYREGGENEEQCWRRCSGARGEEELGVQRNNKKKKEAERLGKKH